MELKHAHQVPFEELLNENIDIVIAACGYESRSSHLIQLSNFNAKKKIALLFKDEIEDENHKKNQVVFDEEGFECYSLSSGSSNEITSVLKLICDNRKSECVKLIVDYSSMAKIWFGAIVSFFAFNDLELNNLVVYFCYTPENFVPHAALKKSFSNPHQVSLNTSSKNQEKPIALLIGLGYDESKVEFLCDFFKPADVYFYLPNPSFDDSYTVMAKNNNKKVLSEVKTSHIMHYPATNIEEIDSRLTSLSLSLRLKYRVIMISLGPKTFSLASFLLNARYPDIEIWNMNCAEQSIDLKPAGVPIVYKAILTSEDDLYN
jgi:hypothetical protein